MSDKQTPKTFECWSLSNTPESDFEIYGVDPLFENCWNAAVEETRAEYEDKIKAMQVEIDKRDEVIISILDGLEVLVSENNHKF
jgi:hypothetical protein